MLLQRILSSLVLIPTILLILYYAPFSIFLLTINIIAFLGIYEFIKMAGKKNIKVNLVIAYGLTFIFIWGNSIPDANLFNKKWYDLLGFIIILINFFIQLKKVRQNEISNNIMWSICIVFYIGRALDHAILLYKLEINLVLLVLLITWANDTGAYAIGTMFGKHKLAPKISPGKSWEGSIAGCIFGITTFIIFKLISGIKILLTISYFEILIGGLIISIAGQLGDLFESYIKRTFNVKDSGNLIPGHGGLLDRIDSLIFAFPVTYYYFQLLLSLKAR